MDFYIRNADRLQQRQRELETELAAVHTASGVPVLDEDLLGRLVACHFPETTKTPTDHHDRRDLVNRSRANSGTAVQWT
ncbi:hypothetical protein AB0N16_30120 [Streptomyces sp. NPDC051105]|uniref:hypothetical protein n=1 Tax=Streptomyces sp. NPDC051105 TaxID=3154843 RepID=UPI003444C6A9